jgi:hypothetical protein
MFHSEQDLLANFICLSPKNARRKFRQQIFEAWDWKCAYCDAKLNSRNATIDHILPKYKGGHSVTANMCCCCSECNRSKGSEHLKDWYTIRYTYFSEKRLAKLKVWMEQIDQPLKIVHPSKVPLYTDNEFATIYATT